MSMSYGKSRASSKLLDFIDRINNPKTPEDMQMALSNRYSKIHKDEQIMMQREIAYSVILEQLVEKYALEQQKMHDIDVENIIREMAVAENLKKEKNEWHIVAMQKAEIAKQLAKHAELDQLRSIKSHSNVDITKLTARLAVTTEAINKLEAKVAVNSQEWSNALTSHIDSTLKSKPLAFNVVASSDGVPSFIPATSIEVRHMLMATVGDAAKPIDIVSMLGKSYAASVKAHEIAVAQAESSMRLTGSIPPPPPAPPTSKYLAKKSAVNLEYDFIVKNLIETVDDNEIFKSILAALKDPTNKQSLKEIFNSRALQEKVEPLMNQISDVYDDLSDKLAESKMLEIQIDALKATVEACNDRIAKLTSESNLENEKTEDQKITSPKPGRR